MPVIGATPVDGTGGGGIPLSCVESPGNTGQTSGGNVIPVPLQGHDGAYLDGSQNPTTAAMFGYIFPRIVQKGHNITGSGGKTLTFAFANNNNFGNSIVVQLGMGEVEIGGGSPITLAVTDSASNTYTKATSAAQSTTLEAAIFYATNIAAGANTVTITIAGSGSSNTAIACEVYEVYGPIQVVGALDQTSTGNNAGSTSPATGALVPTVPGEICFAAVAAAGGTITAGGNFTLDTGGALSPTGGNLVSFGAESQTLTTFASVTPSATLGTSNAWAMCAATFKSIILPIEGAINIAQYGGAATSLGSKTSVNSIPVVVASDQAAIPVSESGTWTVQPGNTPNTSAWLVQNVVASANGSVPYHNITAASTNFTNVKGAAAQMYSCRLSNTSGSAIFVKFYNKATTPGTGDTPKTTVQVPANGTVIGAFPEGMVFGTGFGWAATGAVADNDNTSIAANCVVDFSLNS